MVEGEGEVLNGNNCETFIGLGEKAGPLTLGGGGPVGEAGEECVRCRVHEGVTVASLGGLKSCSSPESSRSEGSEPTKSARLTVERAIESASICIGVSGFYKSSFIQSG